MEGPDLDVASGGSGEERCQRWRRRRRGAAGLEEEDKSRSCDWILTEG